MKANVTELSSLYGVAFYVCGNNEVVRDWLGLDMEHDRDAADDAIRDACSAITSAGHDYELVRSFQAYNGGPRRGLVEPRFFQREATDDGEYSDWEPTREVPADIAAAADVIVTAAYKAMESTEQP